MLHVCLLVQGNAEVACRLGSATGILSGAIAMSGAAINARRACVAVCACSLQVLGRVRLAVALLLMSVMVVLLAFACDCVIDLARNFLLKASW